LPTIEYFAVTKYYESLVMSLVNNAEGEFTGEKGVSIKELPMEPGALDGQLEVQRSIRCGGEERRERGRPDNQEEKGDEHEASEKHSSSLSKSADTLRH
jgi:hypothetical protein